MLTRTTGWNFHKKLGTDNKCTTGQEYAKGYFRIKHSKTYTNNIRNKRI